MAKYLFVYHGGENPETDEEVAAVLDAWGAWFGTMGAAVLSLHPISTTIINSESQRIPFVPVSLRDRGVRRFSTRG